MRHRRRTPAAPPPLSTSPTPPSPLGYPGRGLGPEADAADVDHARRSRRRTRAVLPVVLAGTAVVTVGAAAYSRNVLSHESAASNAAVARDIEASDESLAVRRELRRTDEVERGRSRDAWLMRAAGTSPATVGPSAAPVSGSLLKDPAGNYPGVQIEVGRVSVTRDTTGIAKISLPLRVTNIGYAPRSFDIRVTARDPLGAKITDDTGTVLDLRPGQSAEVHVLDIVNDAISAELQQASFDVTDVFAY